MKNIDPKIWNVVALAWALGGVVALLAYLDQRKSAKIREDVLLLDKQIKEHELNQQIHRLG